MIPRSVRKPSLIDVMILVAATAVGFAGVRAEFGDHYHFNTLYILLERGKNAYSLLNWTGSPPEWYLATRRVASVVAKGSPVVAAWTLALLAIRLRPPRPSWARLSRQPGLVAQAAASVTLATCLAVAAFQVALAALGISAMNDPRFYGNASFLVCRTIRVEAIGIAVLVSWAILALGGRWRPEPGWIDRAGIGVGLAWLALAANDWFLNVMQ